MANDDLYTALKNADSAGDVEAARKIAGYIKGLSVTNSQAFDPIMLSPSATSETGQSRPGMMDVVKTLPGIVAKAAAGAAGLPQTFYGYTADKSQQNKIIELDKAGKFKDADALRARNAAQQKWNKENNIGDAISSGYDKIASYVLPESWQRQGGGMYDPQTPAGRMADFAGQTLLVGKPSAATVAGAITGATANELASDVKNPLIKSAITGTAMLSGGAPFAMRKGVGDIAKYEISSLTPQQIQAAKDLIDKAQKIGTPITTAEAIAQVAGSSRLQDIQRTIEGSRYGADIRSMINQRPQSNQTAFENQVRAITPDEIFNATKPEAIPFNLRNAANDVIEKERLAVNNNARPFYDKTTNALGNFSKLPPKEWIRGENTIPVESVMFQSRHSIEKRNPYTGEVKKTEGTPAYSVNSAPGMKFPINQISTPDSAILSVNSIGQLKRDDVIGPLIDEVKKMPGSGLANAPEGSLAVLDAVKKRLDETANNLSSGIGRDRSNYQASIYQNKAYKLRDMIDKEFPDYKKARDKISEGIATRENPLIQSKVGTIAKQTGDDANVLMDQQRGVIFNKNDSVTTPQSQSQAIGALKASDPTTMRQFVRQGLTNQWDQVTRDLVGGASPQAGAKFAKDIAGSNPQAQNLRATIETASGKPAADGFDTFLEVLRAQGKRKGEGSQTFNNSELRHEMSSGGPFGEVGSRLLAPGSLSTWASDSYKNFQYKGTLQKMSEILLDKNGIYKLEQLSRIEPDSERAKMLVQQLLNGAYQENLKSQRSKQ